MKTPEHVTGAVHRPELGPEGRAALREFLVTSPRRIVDEAIANLHLAGYSNPVEDQQWGEGAAIVRPEQR